MGGVYWETNGSAQPLSQGDRDAPCSHQMGGLHHQEEHPGLHQGSENLGQENGANERFEDRAGEGVTNGG